MILQAIPCKKMIRIVTKHCLRKMSSLMKVFYSEEIIYLFKLGIKCKVFETELTKYRFLFLRKKRASYIVISTINTSMSGRL